MLITCHCIIKITNTDDYVLWDLQLGNCNPNALRLGSDCKYTKGDFTVLFVSYHKWLIFQRNASGEGGFSARYTDLITFSSKNILGTYFNKKFVFHGMHPTWSPTGQKAMNYNLRSSSILLEFRSTWWKEYC